MVEREVRGEVFSREERADELIQLVRSWNSEKDTVGSTMTVRAFPDEEQDMVVMLYSKDPEMFRTLQALADVAGRIR